MNAIQVSDTMRLTPIQRLVSKTAKGKGRPPGVCSLCESPVIRMGEPRSKVKVEMKINPIHPSTDGQTIESTWLHVTRVGGTGSWKIVGSDVDPTDQNGHGVGDFICTTCDLDFLPPGESWEQPELFG